MRNKNYLAIDYGTKRIGLSSALAPLFLPVPMDALVVKNLESAQRLLLSIIREKMITHIIIGNPITLKSKESNMHKDISILMDYMKQNTSCEVILWDERMTSSQAERVLKDEGNLKRKNRVGKVDSLAATFILSSFIESPSFVT